MAVKTDEDVVASNGSLADAAASATSDVPEFDQHGPAQEAMIDEGVMFRFVDVKYSQLEANLAMGEEVAFIIKGRVVGKGSDLMKDGHERAYLKVGVQSVSPA
jgi:hypothetical protein